MPHEHVSLAKVLRHLGRPDNGGQRAMLRQWISQQRIDTAHFLGQAHNRGKPGTIPAKRPEVILVRHDGKRARGVASAPSGSAGP